MGLRLANDDRTVFVANYLSNSVQVVDLQERRLLRSIPLGGASPPSLARRGEAMFFDARRSLDQWYSCHTCHYEGGTNSVAMDTLNDGTSFTFKTVLPLFHVTETAPWTWHGGQDDLHVAVRKSITTTMRGTEPTKSDVAALVAYLSSLTPPPNPHRKHDGPLSESAERGRQVFHSRRAGCASCHSGPYFTDGEVHDVGLGGPRDRHQGFNTPSLLGVHRKVLLLHDGRSKLLHDLLTGPHCPTTVSGTEALSEVDLSDLIGYLRSL